MILYVTKKTKDRFDIPFSNELAPELAPVAKHILRKEQDDLFKWGVKIFYFERRKCLQVMNFASKVTIFLVDVKVKNIKELASMVASYLKVIFEDDEEASELLNRYIIENQISIFDALKDRSVIASLNYNETYFLDDGFRLYDFIEDGIMHTIRLNKMYNLKHLVGKRTQGKKEYMVPGEEFIKLLKQRYHKG